MNLTSKRMLQFMTVCAGACALTATATEFVADSFEAATNTNPIATYKSIVSEDFHTTNWVWISQAGDASTISTNDAANTAFAATTRPMSAAQALLLNLATEGTTLSRMITNGVDACTFTTLAPVYLDTLIKFTPSEDAPTIAAGTKVAVYVNVNSNLVIYHNTYYGNTITTNSVIPGIINPNNWYRLTIEMGAPTFVGSACRIFLNGGAAITNANAFKDLETPTYGGEWFMVATAGTSLSAVAFQGTGAVDELLVTTAKPDVIPSATIMLTLMFNEDQIGVTTGGVAVANTVQVPDSTAIVISSKGWYELDSLGALFVGGSPTNKITGTAMITNINGTVTSHDSIVTNTITAKTLSDSSAQPTGTSSSSYTYKKLADWATAQVPPVTTAQMLSMDSAILDDYLFNVPLGTNPGLTINSITYNGTIATIKVVATTNAVNFSTINGTMGVTTRTNLTAGADFAAPAGFVVTETTSTNKTITIPTAAGPFIKAVVQ